VTDTVLADILARLDLVVFERLPEDVFLRVGSAPPPAWFSRLFLHAAEDEPITIAQALPFIEHFLGDAEDFWRQARDEQRLRSDPFTMADPSGGEIALVASAVVVGDRRFLIIESPYDFNERRRALQSAREHVLAHEEHVRRTGALLTPVAAARQLAEQLAASGLTPEQQQLAVGIVEQLASLSASIETLAPLPKGVSRRRRH
jgi:hypothetical protein